MRQKLACHKGFTLIELIVVIAILAILMAVAVPAYSGVKRDAAAQVMEANCRQYYTAVKAAQAAGNYQVTGNDTKDRANINGLTSQAAVLMGVQPQVSPDYRNDIVLCYEGNYYKIWNFTADGRIRIKARETVNGVTKGVLLEETADGTLAFAFSSSSSLTTNFTADTTSAWKNYTTSGFIND